MSSSLPVHLAKYPNHCDTLQAGQVVPALLSERAVNSTSCFTRTCFHDVFIQFMTLDLALVCTKHSKYLEKKIRENMYNKTK